MLLLPAAASGFLLGASLIIAIGAQNAFILRQGLIRSHVFVLCLICAASDAVLIAAGVGGLGTLVATSPWLIRLVTLAGASFLGCYSVVAFRRAMQPSALAAAGGEPLSLRKALAVCFAFTFLNPHVYLDTVVVLGSLSAAYEGSARLAYGLGAAVASCAWFFGLGYGARYLAPLFERPTAWKILDVVIGLVMGGLALALLLRGASPTA